jgi:hypothetical protein
MSMMASTITLAIINQTLFLVTANTFYISLVLLTMLYMWIFSILQKKYSNFTYEDKQAHRKTQREATLELLESEFENWKQYYKHPFDNDNNFPDYDRLRRLRNELGRNR